MSEHLQNPELDGKQKTKKVFQLNERFGLEFEHQQEFEFFFYTENEDDASNLAIDLFQMNYDVNVSKSQSKKWCINGWTYKMDSDLESITKWSEQMDKLAEKNNCEFDGWGSFCK